MCICRGKPKGPCKIMSLEVESGEDQGGGAEEGVRAGGSSCAALCGRSTEKQRVQETSVKWEGREGNLRGS